MSSDTITKTIFIKAAPETVWTYLTDKDRLAEWFHPADKDLSEGTTFQLMTHKPDGARSPVLSGRVLKANPPSELVYTFHVPAMGKAETTVFWSLLSCHGGTQITVRHEGIAAASAEPMDMLMSIDAGWDRHFARLRTVFY